MVIRDPYISWESKGWSESFYRVLATITYILTILKQHCFLYTHKTNTNNKISIVID